MGNKRCDLNLMAGLFIAAYLFSPAMAAYDVSDLSGTWLIHGAVSGVAPYRPGSFHMTGTGNAGGSVVGTDYADSQGVTAATWPGSATFGLSGGGVLSLEGDAAPFRGVMNWGEDLILSVGTVTPGPDTGLTGYNFWVWVRQSEAPVFSTSDTAGTWWLHGLNSGTSGSAWFRGKLEIATSGDFSFVEGTWKHSEDPSASTPEDGSASITDYGVVGLSFDPTSHGIMNLGKDLIVLTMTDNTGGNLNIFQKRSGASFSTADLAGIWNMYGLMATDQYPEWFYGILEINNSGSLQVLTVTSDGDAGISSETLSITSDGIVTIVGDPNAHGTMSDDKELIVLTMSFADQDIVEGPQLSILMRAVVSPVHRFWSPVYSRHFYTTSEAEKRKLVTTYSHVWTYEQTAYYALGVSGGPSVRPVYRFWSDILNAHFYTISETERDKLITTYSDVWTYEGSAFYAYPEGSAPAEASPVYRFWSEKLGCHFYTIDEAESDKLITTYSHVWTYEGIAWYAYK